MAIAHTATELRKMQKDDLQKEIASAQSFVAKMRLGIGMRSEKNTSDYRIRRKDLARMLTVWQEVYANDVSSEKPAKSALKKPTKASKVPAQSKPSSAV